MKASIALLPILLFPMTGGAPGIPRMRDIIPPGMKSVRFELVFEAPAPGASLCRAYVVLAGDTFEGIARKQCGDARCSDEIALLNPNMKPERLKPGSTLAIPPKPSADSRPASRPDGASREPRLLMHLTPSGILQPKTPVPILEGQILGAFRGQCRVIAVPRSGLRAAMALDWTTVDFAHPPAGVNVSPPFTATSLVAHEDPAVRVEARIVVTSIEDGQVALDRHERWYDEDKRLTREKTVQNGVTKTRGGAVPWPLALIGGGALIGVLGIARRRRTRAACCA